MLNYYLSSYFNKETPTWLSGGEDKLEPELQDTGCNAHTLLDTALLSSTDLTPKGHIVELFNSGATGHITPYHSTLTNYSTIAPKAISAVNRVYQGLPKTCSVFEMGHMGMGTVPHLANLDQTMYPCCSVMGIGGFFHLICNKYFMV